MSGTATGPDRDRDGGQPRGSSMPERVDQDERPRRVGGGMDRERRRELGEAVEEVAEPERLEAPAAPAGTRSPPRDRARRPRTSLGPVAGGGERQPRREREREGADQERRPRRSAASAARGAATTRPAEQRRRPGAQPVAAPAATGPRGEERRAARLRGSPPVPRTIRPTATVAARDGAQRAGRSAIRPARARRSARCLPPAPRT